MSKRQLAQAGVLRALFQTSLGYTDVLDIMRNALAQYDMTSSVQPARIGRIPMMTSLLKNKETPSCGG